DPDGEDVDVHIYRHKLLLFNLMNNSNQEQSSQDIPSTSQEALDVCATLTRRVEHLEHDNMAQDLEITKLKIRVKKLERANKGRMIADLDRDTCIALMDDEGTEKKAEDAQVAGDEHVKGRQAEIYQIDMDHASKVLSMQEDEPKVQEVVDVVTTAKLITEVVAAASESVTAASITIFAVEPQVLAAAITTAALVRVTAASTRRRKGVDDIRPIFEAKFNSNIEFLLKSKEQIEEEENRALESINETPAQKVAKRRKLNEEVEDLKQHLEIVPDEDDDVYTEATPLARKVPVMDYQIIQLNNKPHFKIIRADGTHQLNVWKTRWTRSSLEELKKYPWSRKERRYPLSRFTLDQMLNAVRLQVEEQSEMSLELLRFTRQQLQEGQHE
nr:hypothetical protein [Tanacetum cinerariifolium]